MRRAALLLLLGLLAAAPANAEPADRAPDTKRPKLIAAATIGTIHLSYATWSYFAWYRKSDAEDFHLERGPWFAETSYAGGADKLGHVWSNYALTRGTTALLVAGGWSRLPSSIVAAGLTEVAFTVTELQDGYVFGFDPKDMLANGAGAALAVLMENVPVVDRLLDFKLEYFPSRDYQRAFRETGTVDIGQDYTGQSYILALHLGGVPALADTDWTRWSRYVDVAVGFEAKHYYPVPEVREAMPRQTLYFGLAFNMQGILGDLLPDSTGRRIARGAFEVYSLPYTTLRFAEASRTWKQP